MSLFDLAANVAWHIWCAGNAAVFQITRSKRIIEANAAIVRSSVGVWVNGPLMPWLISVKNILTFVGTMLLCIVDIIFQIPFLATIRQSIWYILLFFIPLRRAFTEKLHRFKPLAVAIDTLALTALAMLLGFCIYYSTIIVWVHLYAEEPVSLPRVLNWEEQGRMGQYFDALPVRSRQAWGHRVDGQIVQIMPGSPRSFL